MKAVSGVYKTFKCTKAAQPVFTKMQQHFSKMNGGKGTHTTQNQTNAPSSGGTKPVPPSRNPEFTKLFSEKTLQKVLEKVPGDHGRLTKNTKGEGLKWETKYGANDIRIDVGDPKAPFPHQRVDHVRVNRDGKVIGRNGEVILESPSIPKPADAPNAHIPLTEWLKWRNFNQI